MEKQRKRMTACLVLAVIIIAIAAMVLMDIAATKITGVQLDVPDTISIDGAKLYLVHRPIDCKPGMLNLYGHVHRQGGIWSPYGFNICTDVNHFRLYSENDIRFLISQKAAWDNDADTKFLAGIK